MLLPCYVLVRNTRVVRQVYREPAWLRKLNAAESAPAAVQAQYMRQVTGTLRVIHPAHHAHTPSFNTDRARGRLFCVGDR
jgi:hypothetical protein